jgi:hypothetical protein
MLFAFLQAIVFAFYLLFLQKMANFQHSGQNHFQKSKNLSIMIIREGELLIGEKICLFQTQKDF